MDARDGSFVMLPVGKPFSTLFFVCRLNYKKSALKCLARMPRGERQRVTGALSRLARDPDEPGLDVRPLQGREGYRLRIGRWRVLFRRQDDDLVILVLDAGARGGIYK